MSAAAVLGVRGTMLSEIPLVGVRGGGRLEASSGLDVEPMPVAVYSEGRRGVECAGLLPIGVGGGRREGVSCPDSQGLTVNGASSELAVEGRVGVRGVEGRRAGRVLIAIGGDEARTVDERRLFALTSSS